MTENKKLEAKTELYEKLITAEIESQTSTEKVEHAVVIEKLRVKCKGKKFRIKK